MSWHKSFDEYVEAQNKGQSSSNSGASSGGNTVTHNGKVYYSGDSRGSAYQSYSRRKKYTEDIAPVASRVITNSKKKKEEEEKKKRKWYDGWFEEGSDNIGRTILGTGADFFEDLTTGIVGMGEKVVDAFAYIAPYAADAQFYSNGGFTLETEKAHREAVEQSKKEMGDFIAKDLYDEGDVARKILSRLESAVYIDTKTQNGGFLTADDLEHVQNLNQTSLDYLENDMENDSVLGEKSDSLIQSTGQLAAQYGLSLAGVPWFVTSGVTSFGGQAEQALNDGATYEEAGASAAISAGAEVLSEKLFGGDLFVGKSGSDLATNLLSRSISNKAMRTLLKLCGDSVGEGFEEVFSEFVSNLGTSLYKEENLGEILFNEEAIQGYIDSFAGGFVMGGAMGSVNVAQSKAAGVDFTSGLTENEQKVVDKLYKEEVASREKEGKVTQKEKSQIYDSILEGMERGDISTDTIEEILGGDSYSAYRDTVDSEDAQIKQLENQIAELGEAPNTVANSRKYDALQSQLDELKNNSQRNALRSKLSEDVMGLVKGSRLEESYNERAKTGQKFEADVTQYDAKQQAVVQKAIDSGILNNSRKTHEFVDFVSKISADTGVSFDFANTDKLREAGYVMEGQTIDGIYDPNEGITVNIDSPKSRQFVVGHEITHALEGTKLYGALRKSVFDYAKMKNQYDARMESIRQRYKEGTDFESELTADLVGEYIFSDTDFINNLSTQNRNVFEKVFDEIKYLYKVATAGSKEAKELERVKRAFEKAYRETDVTATRSYDMPTEQTNVTRPTMLPESVPAKAEAKAPVKAENAPEVQQPQQTQTKPIQQPQPQAQQTESVQRPMQAQQTPEAQPLMEQQPVQTQARQQESPKKGKEIHFQYNGFNPDTAFFNDSENQDSSRGDLNFTINDDNSIDLDLTGKGDRYNNISNWIESDGLGYLYDVYVDGQFVTNPNAVSGYYNLANAEVTARPVLQKLYSGNFLPQQKGQLHFYSDGYQKTAASGNVKYSLSESNSKQLTKEQAQADMTYIDSLNRGDTETAQRMVDDAAKKAGYNSDILYHGTPKFGFTWFDLGRMDDGISIFATSDSKIAESYSGETDRYTIADRELKNVQDMSDSELLKYVQRYIDPKYQLATASQRETLIRSYTESFDTIRQDLIQIAEENANRIEQKQLSYLYELADIVGKMSQGKDVSELSALRMELYEKLGTLNWAAPQVDDLLWKESDDPLSPSGWKDNWLDDSTRQVFENIDEISKNDSLFVTNEANSAEYLPVDIARNQLKHRTENGIYGLYAKTDNLFEFDAQGESWRRIDGKQIGRDGFVTTREVSEYAKKAGYNGVKIRNLVDAGGRINYNKPSDIYILFDNTHVKSADTITYDDAGNVIPLSERFNAENQDIRHSLSDTGEQHTADSLSALRLETSEDIAPVFETENITTVQSNENGVNNPVLQKLYEDRKSLHDQLTALAKDGNAGDKFNELTSQLRVLDDKIEIYENVMTGGNGNTGDLAPTTSDVSPSAENETPYFISEEVASFVDKMLKQDTEAGEDTLKDPFVVYDIDEHVVQRRTTKNGKYMYTIISPDGAFRRGLVEQDIGSFYADIADKLTSLKMEAGGFYETEADVDDNAIASENEDVAPIVKAVPAEAPVRVVASEDGGSLETDKNGFDEDGYVVRNRKHKYRATAESTKSFVMTEQVPTQKADGNTSKNTEQPKSSDTLDVDTSKKSKLSPIKMVQEYFVDNGYVFEKIAKKFKNGAKRSLEAKWNFNRYSRGMAQYLIGHGSKADNVQSLKGIADKVDKSGLTEDFYNYMYNWLNFDRMSVEERYPNSTNRGVFGDAVSAEESLAIVTEYEQAHPEFKEWAEEVYAYNRHLRSMLVDGGIISQKTANLWEDMFPHYVPIRRFGVDEDVEVKKDTKHIGFETPVYEFEGSNKRIRPMFDTMAERTLLTFNAVNMNDFGIELYETLYPGRSTKNTSLDPTRSNVGMKIEDLDSFFDPQTELLQSGENGKNPAFSVFMDGERHTFDITNEMYEAMKPANDALSYKVPVLSDFSDIRRKLITEYNPWFMLKNAIKDSQDVLMNSQHPLKTYGEMMFEAPMELFTKGQWYQEYLANGGNQNSYFDSENGSLMGEQKAIDKVKKIFGLDAISKMNEFIETVPRLAEYIASRKAGRSIQVSMLDAARVTTNFAAGGQATKFLNRNGATFLNASVQGAVQFGRNIAEAKQNGLKGWVSLAARMTALGIIPEVLNRLIWDDDDDFQKQPDYIKDNYYVIAKYGDGQFLRLPKGRVAAFLQEAVEQLDNATSENGKADWDSLYKSFMENVAPNNALTDNVFAPIGQVVMGKTWYGEDIEPYRLRITHDENGNEMDVPVTKRFDEKTSNVSIWLSEQLQDIPMTKWMDLSPKEIHYLLDQYSGILGDTFLPMDTPKAESPIDNKAMKLLAPLRDIFTTDTVLNNRVTGDFYDALEAAEAQAASENATMEDKFRSGMLIGYNAELSDLYKEQRKIQMDMNLSDSEKYERTREIKKEINSLQEQGLAALENYSIDGNYAESGDKRYNYDSEDDTWWEVKPKLADGRDNWYYTEEQMFHDNLGVSYSDYWNGRLNPEDYDVKTLYDVRNGKRYNFDMEENAWFEITPKTKDGEDNYFYQQEQLAHNKLGVSYEDFWNNREAYIDANYVADRWGEPFYETAKTVFGAEHFAEVASGMADISADKDADGNSISGSRKRKMQDYIYSLDIPEIEKHILFKSQYSYTNKHNYEIIDYLNDRDDISYSEMESILTELGFKVDKNGRITW